MSQGNLSRSGALASPSATPTNSRNIHTIVLICPRNDKASASVSDPFLLSLIGQLGDALAKRNCELLVSTFAPGNYDWKKQFIDTGRAQGLIIFGHGTFPNSIELLAQKSAPFVVWGSPSADNNYCTVGSDNEKGGYLATKHLLDVGRRHIAFLGDYSLPEIKERYLGYRRALKEVHIKEDSNLVVQTHPQAYSTFDSVYNRLVEKHVEFDAIVASTDLIALEAMTILKKLGLKIPDDVSVVGYDDIPTAKISDPPLTTVVQDISFAAREIVGRLFGLIRQEKSKSLRLPVKLIERVSSHPKIEARGVLTLSRKGMIEYLDHAAEHLLGYKVEEMIGKDFNYLLPDPMLISKSDIPDFSWREFLEENSKSSKLIYLETKNGDIIPIEIAISRRQAKQEAHVTCVIWDARSSSDDIASSEHYQYAVEQAVAERTEQLTQVAQKMERLAFEDPLTGLNNRRYLDQSLKNAIKYCLKKQKHLSLVMFDVDFFKAYNDNYGHLAGDACLKQVARVIQDHLAVGKNTVARYGGEEFAVVLPGIDKLEAKETVSQLLKALRHKKIIHEYSMVADHVTMSCGIYSYLPVERDDAEKLIWKADKALYRAKGAGRNQIVLETPENASHS